MQACKPACVETGIKAALPWGRVNSWFSHQLQQLHWGLPDAVHNASWRYREVLDGLAQYMKQATNSSTRLLVQWVGQKEQLNADDVTMK